jgi:hypothetical protein
MRSREGLRAEGLRAVARGPSQRVDRGDDLAAPHLCDRPAAGRRDRAGEGFRLDRHQGCRGVDDRGPRRERLRCPRVAGRARHVGGGQADGLVV